MVDEQLQEQEPEKEYWFIKVDNKQNLREWVKTYCDKHSCNVNWLTRKLLIEHINEEIRKEKEQQ